MRPYMFRALLIALCVSTSQSEFTVTALAGSMQSQSTLPAPSQSADVGDVGTPGDAFEAPDGELFMAGAGSDIWGTEDSFRFVYRPLPSDGRVAAVVAQETNTDEFAKAGIMIRQSLDPSAPHVILDVKPDGGVEFMTRPAHGGETTFIAGSWVPVTPDDSGAVVINALLSLTRIGTTVTADVCHDGSCETVGTASWIEGAALAGAATTSHDRSRLNHASFRVTVTTDELTFPSHLTDVGDVGLPGQASSLFGVTTVSAAGADIWGTADSFTAVTQPISFSAMVVARVLDMEDTHPFAKAGVIMGALSPSSARAILDVKPDGGIEFMVRQADGAEMSFRAGTGATFPVWLRLLRTGNDVRAEVGSDGANWAPIGAASVNFSGTVEAGVAVTSHDTSVRNTARFDRVLLFGTGNAQNLLVNSGFEDSTIPALGPGWVSDRQSAAQTETTQPRAGTKNAVCRTSESEDCGIFQEVTVASNGFYVFRVFAATDKPGALVGMNINEREGERVTAVTIGEYRAYSMVVLAFAGDVIRVWAYSPAAPGSLVIDDASLAMDTGPH